MQIKEVLLGVNIDHVATLRNARGTSYPDPVHAADIAERAGADGITVHLREDRRHINDRDVEILARTLNTRMNLEMAVTDEMLAIAKRTNPAFCCLVPEKRAELTTEGGLNVAGNLSRMQDACGLLAEQGILVSLFIDAEPEQIDAAVACKVPYIEIHTGQYADAPTIAQQQQELAKLTAGIQYAHHKGLHVNAGHGLHYHTVEAYRSVT